jgi:hypothetical protein
MAIKNVGIDIRHGKLIITVNIDGDESVEATYAANEQMALALCERMFAGNEFLTDQREAARKLAVADKQLRVAQRAFDQANLDHEAALDNGDIKALPGAKERLARAEADLGGIRPVHTEATARLRQIVLQALSGDRSGPVQNAMYAELTKRIDAGKEKLAATIRQLDPVVEGIFKARSQDLRIRERVSGCVNAFVRSKLLELLGADVVAQIEGAAEEQRRGQGQLVGAR